MPPKQPGAPRSREEELTNEKERVTQDVRMRFAKYGDEALSIVLSFALQPARMPMLLERVNVAPRGRDLSAQLDAINEYIAQEGAARFGMLALQKHYKKDQHASVLLNKIEAQLSAQLERTVGELPPEKPEKEAPKPAVEAKKAEEPKPAARAEAPPEAAPPPPRPDAPHINAPGYSGPDRRAGTERRSKPDRRAGLAAVNKNKRYGGDRRKRSKGRRKEDQVKIDFWWRLLGTRDEHRIHGGAKPK